MTGFNDKPTLSFNRVRLEPLTLQHEAGLREEWPAAQAALRKRLERGAEAR